MSETNKYPGFWQSFESRQPLTTEQLEHSRRIFDDLFDDVMLQNVGDVKCHEFIKGRPTASLLKHIVVDDQQYTLSLEDISPRGPRSVHNEVSFRDSETHARVIDLQRIEKGCGREYWSYRLGSDGVVRRWDGGDMFAKGQKERELGIEEPLMLDQHPTREEMIGALVVERNNLIENVIPNGRLEEDMGFNNQPVSPEELEGLRDFLGASSDRS